MNKRALLVAITSAAAFLAAVAPAVRAGKPEDMFKGKIIITRNKLPIRFASAGAFVSALQSGKTDRIKPSEQRGNDFAEWNLEYAAFFAQPLDDYEIKAKFFDITAGRKLVAATEQFVREKGQRYFMNSVKIGKPEFDVNKHYMMTLESRGRVLATTTFWLLGKGPNYSGKVEFSDDDARGR